MVAYLKVAHEAAAHRESHRVTEAEFIRMRRQPGAINISFPDIAIESLARLLPDKDARILIYCNNNFENDEDAFPSKMPSASLNVSTYISLFTYGYRNVYELGPLLDVEHTKLVLEPTR
ncbi:MAG TPA: rhodanese-like domain-containing protein [Polyangia bacterium]